MVLHEGAHRRDEDRRRQDARRHPRRSISTRSPARACTSSPSTTTSPAATPSGWARSTASSASPSASSCTGSTTTSAGEAYACDITYGTNNEYGFDYLRDNMKYEMRADGAARARLRHRRRGRLDPGRRGAHAAHHLGPARRPLGPLRRHRPAHPAPRQERLRARREAAHGVAHRERQREDGDRCCARPACSRRATSTTRTTSPSSTTSTRRLRAHTLFQRDKDYIVRNSEVVIIDEFTGRMMPGRRYSEGLHQALEAKERVQVQPENQTLASITFQNYFRLYKQARRHDRHGRDRGRRVPGDLQSRGGRDPDQPAGRARSTRTTRSTARSARSTRRSSARSRTPPSKGQPILVGTTSIEKSEHLAELLTGSTASSRSTSRRPTRSSRSTRPPARARARSISPCSTPASTSRRPSSSRRPACRGRSPSRPTWRAAAPTSSSAATPRCASSTSCDGLEDGPERDAPGGGDPGRGGAASRSGPSRPAASTSSAPSGTRAGASTTSCAAARAARAIPGAPSSSCRSRTT